MDTIRAFRLGYADREGRGLPSHLLSGGVSMETARRAGLVSIRGGVPYDYLRGRVIFPIRDVTGRVIAFGGRVIGDGMPKYLNSPESPLFKKRGVLYGLDLAKEWIVKEGAAIVVEGYMDLIALYQHGVRNVVATLGTALTQEHVGKLRRYGKRIYSLFDSDEAGRKAALRGVEVFLKEDIDAKVVLLPPGRDPDQFVREEGRDGLMALLKGAIPVFDFYLQEVSRGVDMEDLPSRMDVLKEVAGLLGRLGDPLRIGLYVKGVSERLGVDESAIASAVARRLRGRGDRQEPPLVVNGPPVEETIIWALASGYDLGEYHIPSILEAMEDRELRRAGKAILDEGGLGVEDVIGLVEREEVKARLSRVALMYDGMEEDRVMEVVRDCIRKVKLRRLKREKEWLKMEIKRSEEEGREERLLYLLRRRQDLSRIEHSPEALLYHRWGEGDEEAL